MSSSLSELIETAEKIEEATFSFDAETVQGVVTEIKADLFKKNVEVEGAEYRNPNYRFSL